jgi:hypothetical protein
MQRLIDRANKDLREYLLSLIGTEKGKHLVKKNIEANEFRCMATDIDWKDVPDDLDLTGYEFKIVNVLYEDCRLSIIYDGNGNRINILLPRWIQTALFAADQAGLASAIRLLEKLKYEEDCTFSKQPIPYSNTVS